MAGGKQSARQKMINLMYLVFIAMIAMNMSKEVLSAFGLMNAKLIDNNQSADVRNAQFMQGLADKVEEQPAKYAPLKADADQITALGNDLSSYLEDLKGKMTATVKDPSNYETMDGTDWLDQYFFNGDKTTPKGKEFLAKIAEYRNGVKAVLADNPDLKDIVADVEKKFATDKVTNNDGKQLEWLDYHYKGFPLVASLTKMTQLQSDIKTTEAEMLSSMLAGKLKVEASLTNFEAIVVADKTAFFNGEQFSGKIILGKNDKTLRADKVIVNGQELPEDAMQAGQTLLKFPAGRVGEQKIKGEFQFKEGDSIITLPFESSYAVIPKPNAATISADKMNVVYRGVQNPMTISFAGVPDNKVQASANGLSPKGGGKYVMTPGTGKEVTINVTGTLPDGTKVSDNAKFRIKDIPKPFGQIAGRAEGSLPRNNIEIGTIKAVFDDFDFDLPLTVTSFKFKVPGQATVNVSGNKLNGQAKAALRKARRGDAVQIFDIKSKSSGGPRIKPASPISIEVAN
ncbi:gliding motility protein GldM [Olleya sp. YS]|uniref:type IX secretion system motor protein PorM/GldM n=1 Tax=Olleya sp. YS TaxID=3028318 RepID=UPI0024345438|nr:gliding motility protein GldM [Olleya sp. YS]WGD33651.1 gliding motility protein GldM [Olleya sp. YS]